MPNARTPVKNDWPRQVFIPVRLPLKGMITGPGENSLPQAGAYPARMPLQKLAQAGAYPGGDAGESNDNWPRRKIIAPGRCLSGEAAAAKNWPRLARMPVKSN